MGNDTLVKVRNLSTSWYFKLNLWRLILILFNEFKAYKGAWGSVWFGLWFFGADFASMISIDLNRIYSTYCFDCKYRSVSVQSATGGLLNLEPYKSKREDFMFPMIL